MKSSEIREKYLNFFEAKGHKRIPSASLVPEGDSTTLFTGSGMQPMVPYLLGQKHPLGNRLVDSQKSFRAEDIEEVGDNRHTTFFEMLGNWSLGDYWKEEQLSWLFDFLINEIGLDPNRLYVSVFSGNEKYNIAKDTESAAIWKKLFGEKNIDAKEVELGSEANGYKLGMQGGRIFFYQDKNWWSRAGLPETMPVGEPGGPDSEIFYEFTEVEHDVEYGENCHPNCDCGRYLEIGNSVFMQYQKQEDGSFKELPQKNVDFGGGLERITAASNNDPDVFKIDTFKGMIDVLTKQGDPYGTGHGVTSSIRIILDHVRASVFLIADGVLPGNKDRGYVLRRLIRRAINYIDVLDHNADWSLKMSELVHALVGTYAGSYSELVEKQDQITGVLQAEVEKFIKTLDKGRKELDRVLVSGSISGKDAFDLYQTFGYPWELTLELVTQKGLTVARGEFEQEFKKHQELSRTASAGQFKGGLASHSDKIIRLHTATHLMNAALRKVLGENVWQKGSNITEERTRFDFAHDKKMTDEEKQQVEELVNGWISRDLQVKKETMPLERARALGAIGVFGEKYPETVSVYIVFDPKTEEIVSREFCGGPHVEHTGTIGKFKIQKEEAVSAGVRRIKAMVE